MLLFRFQTRQSHSATESNKNIFTRCCLLTDVMTLFLSSCGWRVNERHRGSEQRGGCCIINSAAGRAVVKIQIYWWKWPCRCHRSEMCSPCISLPPRARVQMCAVYFCLDVYLACVCSVKRDGKLPGSSSSFGTKGNMTQMDAISPNRSGPAAQETREKTFMREAGTQTCSEL